MPYYKKTITSGNIVEVKVYYATRDGKQISRGCNVDETKEEQEARNKREAEKNLTRLIACNFDGKAGDISMTLAHKEEITEEEARAEARKAIEALRRIRRKRGLPELKYIIVTEKQGRWHHHIITNAGITLDDLVAVWGDRGRKHISIAETDDYETVLRLAKYMISDYKTTKGKRDAKNGKEKRRKYERRWNGSRNLAKPKIEKVEIKKPNIHGRPRVPKGAKLLPNWYTGCDAMGNIYKCYAYMIRNTNGEGKAKPTAEGPKRKKKQERRRKSQ